MLASYLPQRPLSASTTIDRESEIIKVGLKFHYRSHICMWVHGCCSHSNLLLMVMTHMWYVFLHCLLPRVHAWILWLRFGVRGVLVRLWCNSVTRFFAEESHIRIVWDLSKWTYIYIYKKETWANGFCRYIHVVVTVYYLDQARSRQKPNPTY
jgi:hypothetical protein